jgi:catechol 2,3-dioxygenase-like lactoylglutathione lyase family enzyme
MKMTAKANPPRIGPILETSLYVDDLDQAAVFYQSALGLRLLERETDRHLFFKCGEQMFLLFNPAKTIAETDAAPHGARGPGHVAFAVPMSKMSQWKSYLEANGVEIEKDVTWPNGGRSIYFRDPANNCLELASPRIWGMHESKP